MMESYLLVWILKLTSEKNYEVDISHFWTQYWKLWTMRDLCFALEKYLFECA